MRRNDQPPATERSLSLPVRTLHERSGCKECARVGKGKLLFGAVAFVVIVGSCNNARNEDDAPSAASGASNSAAAAQVVAAPAVDRPVESECFSDDTVYDGDDTCHPGGELVSVARVLDGNTMELVDGRAVRLLGVQVPDADACAGPGSTEFTRGLVEGVQVKLHTEPGVESDETGRLLRYVQYSESTDRDGLPMYAHDLGHQIVLYGWGKPTDDQANATYDESIASAAGIAEYQAEGIYAPPCGNPKVYGDDDGNGVADWDEEVYVDAPSGNLPDGALTGGFCARKRWC